MTEMVTERENRAKWLLRSYKQARKVFDRIS
jgi:hypothetical protein